MTTVLRSDPSGAGHGLGHALLPPHRRDRAGALVRRPTAAADSRKCDPRDYSPSGAPRPAISDDGKWVTCMPPNDGDSALRQARSTATNSTIPIGSAGGAGRGGGGGGGRGGGGGGASVQFSDNGRWIGYYVNPPARAAGRGRGSAGGRGAGRGAPPQRGGTEPGASPTANAAANPEAVRRFELLDLTPGAKVPVPNAGGFQFSKGSEWLAIKMTGAPNDTSHRGTDLLLRRLSTGTTQNIGNVNQYDFGDADDCSPTSMPPPWATACVNRHRRDARARWRGEDYDGLTWATDSTRLAVLRDETKAKSRRKTFYRMGRRQRRAAQAVGWDRRRRRVPAGLRAERIHGAALDEGRRASAEGAGGLAVGERRAAGESRHLTLEGRRAAVRADHPRGPGAARDVLGRRDRRVEEIPQAGR